MSVLFTTTMLTTTMPCPPWCIRSGAHEFEAGPDGRGWSRRHHHPVRWLQYSHADGSMPTVSVWMSQTEQAVSFDGPAVSQPVEIIVDGCANSRLSGPQARQLAAALLDAADLWDAAHEWTTGIACP